MVTSDKVETGTNDSRAQAVERLLKGAVDLHCHSGPSVMPRDLDHIEALQEAAAVGMKGILFKDHYYSATPVTELLQQHYQSTGVTLMSGVPLNNPIGNFNVHAVDHGFKLGARLVWMPTFSAANHIAHHKKDKDFHKKFPTTKEKMLEPQPLSVLDERGKLKDEVKIILDLIAENDAVLSAGHLHISEIWPLFEEAEARGVKRRLVNHPTYLIDASLEDIRTLSNQGVYLEHSTCMFVPGSKFQFFDAENLRTVIEAGTVERTILGSDLGQVGNPRPVAGFRHVIGMCLDVGYSEDQVRQMISRNACSLMGLE